MYKVAGIFCFDIGIAVLFRIYATQELERDNFVKHHLFVKTYLHRQNIKQYAEKV